MSRVGLLVGAVICATALLGGCAPEPHDTEPRTDGSGTAPAAMATPTPSEPLPDLCPPQGKPAAKDAKALPSMTLNCLGSEDTRDLRALAGRPMVINFWASWCGPCKVELPLLARADSEWGDQVAFLGVDVQDASAEAWRSLTEAGLSYPQLEDPKGRTRAPFGWQSGLPLTVFVDEHGRMVGTERTAFRTYPELSAALRRHLGALTEGNP